VPRSIPRRVAIFRPDVPAQQIAAGQLNPARQLEFRQQYGSDYCADLDLIFANPDGAPLKSDSVSSSVSAP